MSYTGNRFSNTDDEVRRIPLKQQQQQHHVTSDKKKIPRDLVERDDRLKDIERGFRTDGMEKKRQLEKIRRDYSHQKHMYTGVHRAEKQSNLEPKSFVGHKVWRFSVYCILFPVLSNS